jgi:hypothetical protein
MRHERGFSRTPAIKPKPSCNNNLWKKNGMCIARFSCQICDYSSTLTEFGLYHRRDCAVLQSSRTYGGRAPECLLEAVAETALHSAAIVPGVWLAEERRFKNAASVRNIEVIQDVGATDIGDQCKMISSGLNRALCCLRRQTR